MAISKKKWILSRLRVFISPGPQLVFKIMQVFRYTPSFAVRIYLLGVLY